MKKYLLLLILIAIMNCTPYQMVIRNDEFIGGVNPIGLYVISSTQILDDNDATEKLFVIKAVNEKVSQKLNTNEYQIQNLNSTLKEDQVFKKDFGSFDIDEKKIAQEGFGHGCKSVLIFYLAFINKSIVDGKKIYHDCSIYSWLVNTNTKQIMRSSHIPMASYDDFIRTSHEKASIETFGEFVKYLADITVIISKNEGTSGINEK